MVARLVLAVRPLPVLVGRVVAAAVVEEAVAVVEAVAVEEAVAAAAAAVEEVGAGA